MRLLTTLSLAILASQTAMAEIIIHNGDAADEGFNEATYTNPAGGNAANLLGQARLNAFRHAALLIDGLVSSSVPIDVDAEMNELPGDDTFAVLGGAGALDGDFDFTGAPLANTWYVSALANALAGTDLFPTHDIGAEFNSSVDGNQVLGSVRWYYGYTPTSNPSIDFVDTVKHEIIHGIGFFPLVNSAGQLFDGRNDAYTVHLEDHDGVPADFPSMTDGQRAAAMIDTGNLHWTGANVRAASSILSNGATGDHVHMYAPNPYQQGSSTSHFDITLDPDELMEPFITPVTQMVLTTALLQDIGWTIANANPTVPQADLMLAITQSSSTLDNVSGEATADVELTITNQSGNPARYSTVTLWIPAGFTIDATTPSQGACTTLGSLLRCDLGDLSGSGTATVDVSVSTRYKGTHNLLFNVSSPHADSDVTDNNDTLVVVGIDPGFPYSGSSDTGGLGGMGLFLIGLLPLLFRRKHTLH